MSCWVSDIHREPWPSSELRLCYVLFLTAVSHQCALRMKLQDLAPHTFRVGQGTNHGEHLSLARRPKQTICGSPDYSGSSLGAVSLFKYNRCCLSVTQECIGDYWTPRLELGDAKRNSKNVHVWTTYCLRSLTPYTLLLAHLLSLTSPYACVVRTAGKRIHNLSRARLRRYKSPVNDYFTPLTTLSSKNINAQQHSALSHVTIPEARKSSSWRS